MKSPRRPAARDDTPLDTASIAQAARELRWLMVLTAALQLLGLALQFWLD